jgi:hypothetical protein
MSSDGMSKNGIMNLSVKDQEKHSTVGTENEEEFAIL